jgi:flagellar motility protein MotE (MotC chaperone)
MMWKMPQPRLLPATIATLAALLVLKCGVLLDVAVLHGGRLDNAIVATANAASTERTGEGAPARGAESTPARGGEHAAPEHGKSPGHAPAAAEQNPVSSPPKVEGPPPVSESERVLLQDLRQRRKELDARAEAVAARESLMAATEQKLTARVAELQTLQKTLQSLDAAQKQKEETGWQGLVKLYEAMKPRDAATIFNDLQMPVLLQVVDRMKDARAAAVLAAMNPDKARDVTAELAQLRTGKNAAQMAPGGTRANQIGG